MGSARLDGRRPWPLLAAWWSVGAIAVSLVTILLVQAATPTATAEPARRIPSDIAWSFIVQCLNLLTVQEQNSDAQLYRSSVTPDGTVTVDLGTPTEPDQYGNSDYIPNPPASATVNKCLAEDRVEVRDSWREPTAGERLLLYDWVHRWEAPCLTAHGMATTLPHFTEFVDDELYPWYLVNPSGRLRFDELLEVRTACEPIPPFLRAAGVGW